MLIGRCHGKMKVTGKRSSNCCCYCKLLVLWLSIVTLNDKKVSTKAVSCSINKFDVTRIRPRLGGLPYLEKFTWQIRQRASAGHPTFDLKVIKLKWEITQCLWTAGLAYLPGVPNLRWPTSATASHFKITQFLQKNSSVPSIGSSFPYKW